jgi:transposase
MPRPKKYPDELVARGVRLAHESERPIAHIAANLGMHPETLRKKVRQHEADTGARAGLPTSEEREEIRRFRRENFELRRAMSVNGRPRDPPTFHAPAEARRAPELLRRSQGPGIHAE